MASYGGPVKNAGVSVPCPEPQALPQKEGEQSVPERPVQTLSKSRKREFHSLVRNLFKTCPTTGCVFSKPQQPRAVQDELSRALKGLARKWRFPLTELSTRATDYANRLHNDHGVVNSEGIPQLPDKKQLVRVEGLGNLADPADVIEKPLPRRPGLFRKELKYDSECWYAKALQLAKSAMGVAHVEEIKPRTLRLSVPITLSESALSTQETLLVHLAEDYRSIARVEISGSMKGQQEVGPSVKGTLDFKELVTRYTFQTVAFMERMVFIGKALMTGGQKLGSPATGSSHDFMEAALSRSSIARSSVETCFLLLLQDNRHELRLEFPPCWPLVVGKLRVSLQDRTTAMVVTCSEFEALQAAFTEVPHATVESLGQLITGCEALLSAQRQTPPSKPSAPESATPSKEAPQPSKLAQLSVPAAPQTHSLSPEIFAKLPPDRFASQCTSCSQAFTFPMASKDMLVRCNGCNGPFKAVQHQPIASPPLGASPTTTPAQKPRDEVTQRKRKAPTPCTSIPSASNLHPKITQPPERRSNRLRRTVQPSKRAKVGDAPHAVSDDEEVSKNSKDLSVRYPAMGERMAHLAEDDIGRLEKGLKLNNALVDFFSRYLEDQCARSRHKVAIMSSFFCTRVFEAFQGVRTPRPDLLRKALAYPGAGELLKRPVALIPVVDSTHWTCFVLVNPVKMGGVQMKARLLHLDSYRRDDLHKRMVAPLQRFLAQQAGGAQTVTVASAQEAFPCIKAYVPQQKNAVDCGLFMLRNMELIVADPKTVIEKLANEHMDGWYSEDAIVELRSRILSIVANLQRAKIL